MYRLKRKNVIKETDSAVKRDRLIEQGFVLLSEETKPAAADDPERRNATRDDSAEGDSAEDNSAENDAVKEKSLEEMTVLELRQVAKEKGVDISGAKLKDEIVAAIRAAEETQEEPEQTNPESISAANEQESAGAANDGE